MPDSRKYSLRPQARSLGDSTLAGAFRAFMSPADLQSEGISQGDYVRLVQIQDSQYINLGSTSFQALTWSETHPNAALKSPSRTSHIRKESSAPQCYISGARENSDSMLILTLVFRVRPQASEALQSPGGLQIT